MSRLLAWRAMAEPVHGPLGAVVVTHDRRELLRACLQALAAQTHPLDAILVVDNACTDGTREMLTEEFPEVQVHPLPVNEGSSGGFHEGMRRGLELGFAWLWVMDDDTIPFPDALERLVDGATRLDELPDPVVLASKVVWSDGNVHPLNGPGLRLNDIDLFLRASERGVLPLLWNTFPAALLKAEALERHGLPLKHFWIWGDDIEFFARLMHDEVGYLIPDSVAEHRTKAPAPPWEGGDRFYYALRNGIYIVRGQSLPPAERRGFVLLVVSQSVRYLMTNRFRPHSIALVLRGLRDGLRGPGS